MSALPSIVIRATAWSVLLLLGVGLPFGMIIGAGSAAGAWLGILCIDGSVSFRGRAVPAVVVANLVVLAVLLASVPLSGLLPMGWTGVVSWNFLAGAFFGSVLVPCVMLVSRMFGSNIMEVLAAGLVASIPFFDASGGHFERPRWFADQVIGSGGDPVLFLSWTGIFLILLPVMGLLAVSPAGKRVRQRTSRSSRKPLLGIALVIFLAGGLSFLLSKRLPPVAAVPIKPPRPPLSFSGTPPPPPPPPDPCPVAAVQFSDIPRGSPRLKGFYFRKPDPECFTNPMPSGPRVLQMTLWYLKEGEGPLVTPGESLEMMVHRDFERAKSVSWSATKMPSISGHDDFMVHADDESDDVVSAIDSLGIRTNTPVAPSREIERLIQLMDSTLAGKRQPPASGLVGILSRGGKAERVAASPSLQAALITDWIGRTGTLDEKSTDGSISFDEFGKTGVLRGTGRQFSQLAVDALKSRGIEARLAEGYFVPSENQPDDRILITEGNKDVWPEVRTASGVWMPLPVRPQKVSSNEKPPQQEDRKKEIFDALRKKDASKHSEPLAGKHVPSVEQFKKQAGWAGALLILSVFLFLITKRILFPFFLILGSRREVRSRILFKTLAEVSERKYGTRGFGQTWEQYAVSVIEPLSPRRAEILRKVGATVSFSRSLPLGPMSAANSFLLFHLACLMPQNLHFRPRSTNHPIPAINQ